MSMITLPQSWATALQAEIINVLRTDTHLQPLAGEIIGGADGDVLAEVAAAIARYGVGIYVWPANLKQLHVNVPGLRMPQVLEQQIDIRELPSPYNATGVSAHDLAEYIIGLLHGATFTLADGRRGSVIGHAEPIQTEIEEFPGLNNSVTTASIFFDIRPQRAAQLNPQS